MYYGFFGFLEWEMGILFEICILLYSVVLGGFWVYLV